MTSLCNLGVTFLTEPTNPSDQPDIPESTSARKQVEKFPDSGPFSTPVTDITPPRLKLRRRDDLITQVARHGIAGPMIAAFLLTPGATFVFAWSAVEFIRVWLGPGCGDGYGCEEGEEDGGEMHVWDWLSGVFWLCCWCLL